MKFDTFANEAMYNKKNPYIRYEGVHHKIAHRCVCPRCTRGLTLTDTRKSDPVRKFQTCVLCGWHGPKESTLTLQEVLKNETILKGGVLHLR